MDTLVLTKLRTPAARAYTISRARLVERLGWQGGTRLVLVCAPAGYGKTTLLSEWAQRLRQTGAAVAWYSIDPADDSAPAFGAYLVASLMEALGPLPELAQAAQLLRATPEIDLQRILPAVINAVIRSEREWVLILDDYHQIGTPAIHTALAFLLERLPENLHVAIGSRSDPPLPLARLRARGQLLELRAAELRFSQEETAVFLKEVMRLALQPESVGVLAERTEGWVAGLQLAALSLAGRANADGLIATFSGSHRYLVDYLLEEVFERQPEEVQTFLLDTSILERMCRELCDAVRGLSTRAELAPKPDPQSQQAQGGSTGSPTSRGLSLSKPQPSPGHDQGVSTSSTSGRGGSTSGGGATSGWVSTSSTRVEGGALLEQLEAANLFVIALDDQGQWYRYHHLFRDFLQARLHKTHPERIPALHRAASDWYAANGHLRAAVEHALHTQDWDYTAALVENHGYTLITHSEIATLSAWCAAFPEEVMLARPMLCILQSWTLVLGLRRQNHSRIAARLAHVEGVAAQLTDPQLAGLLLDQVKVVRSYLSLTLDPAADPQAALAQAQARLRSSSPDAPDRYSSLLSLAYAQLALHEAEAASATLTEARQAARQGNLYLGMVEAAFREARLAHEQSRLEQAAEVCRQARAEIAGLLAYPEQDLPGVGCLEIALGCIHMEQDRLVEAEAALLHGLDLIGWGLNPYYLLPACLGLFHLRQIQGRPDEALAYLARLDEAWPDIAFYTQGLRIAHALSAAPHDPAARSDAARWLERHAALLDPAGPLPGMGPLAGAEVFYLTRLAGSRLQVALGAGPAARATLAPLLALARAHRLEGRVKELSLLDAQAREVESAGEAPTLEGSEGLSERELEVLRLIARGATNQEIAAALFITIGTVKSHINHILGKLDAHNRTEAVARARALGLIEI